jgi:hypothetical protein
VSWAHGVWSVGGGACMWDCWHGRQVEGGLLMFGPPGRWLVQCCAKQECRRVEGKGRRTASGGQWRVRGRVMRKESGWRCVSKRRRSMGDHVAC